MHASLLAVQVILEPSTESDALLLAHILVLAAVMWGFVAAIGITKRAAMIRKPDRSPVP